jgi:hypothetical protein
MNKKNINITSILLLILLIIIGIGIGLGIARAKGLLADASLRPNKQLALSSKLNLGNLMLERKTVELGNVLPPEVLLSDVAVGTLLPNLTTRGSLNLLQS